MYVKGHILSIIVAVKAKCHKNVYEISIKSEGSLLDIDMFLEVRYSRCIDKSNAILFL